ncbi:2-octaprenyl-6-methoxyphenol hydroxylase [Legionella massiliensis]|uniref:2-octaprenyl-6-methoxyphenol hydroxylase n=1 Tax=Legionella massiliensis TaxID=1034943 RepID=A0A078KWI9_9GAMM|nr:FAD-dependent monooxygenase [Legionella massiliensis]CDZ76114.1 2-octaprenyl-6-methoxyphenol hydroxylase [Legionella massiliensis]CEE11852.1 2-octaprenyl-6-methoxyphenol hydroxylase [Legionella massiliensis]
MADKQVDILIIGGGLTGAILQLALASTGYRCLVVDANPLDAKVNPDFDARSLALSPASVRILQMLSLWPLLASEATAIARIHVSEQGRFGGANIRGKLEQPLGYVVEMQHINRAIDHVVDKSHILASARLSALDVEQRLATINTPKGELAVQAKLIVAADGTESAVRKLSGLTLKIKDYQQQALVTNIGLARSHHNIAYERFTTSGPLALLPMTEQRSSLVWALSPEEAIKLQALDEASFLHSLQKAFGYRLGRFIRVGKRVIYPLRQVTMPQKVAWPLVFVGNAAHTLHPVAGQGFNLGLRDVASLAQCIIQDGLSEAMLHSYQQMRQHDEWAITHFTNGLIDVFTSRLPGMATARNLGLLAVDNFAVLKRCLTHYTRGFAGVTPDLVCGISLDQKEPK